MELTGWCFDASSSEPTQARLLVADQIYPCESGLPRSDVAADFPGLPQAAVSGFRFRGWVPLGYHQAHLEVGGNQQGWRRVKSLPYCSELGPLIGGIDSPEGDTIEEGFTQISGWALHPQDLIEELYLQAGGVSVKCEYGLARPDVLRAFPKLPQARLAGFACRVELREGRITFRLKARLRSGLVVIHPSHKTVFVKSENARAVLHLLDQERASLLKFPAPDKPKVSIIIPVFNQIAVTLLCLKSIYDHTSGSNHEVIVVDDLSEETTNHCLQRVEGLRLLKNKTNQGFLRSSNAGAAAARGEYLLFLNNDTEVTSGWREALLRVFELRADAGLVGAKLLFPDGRLQEAGGIMWRDASGVNYGKWDNPDKPEYNYLREVDYCSGACILLKKSLFERLGAFDPIYAPAYYEDTDLAFKVRKARRKVYYQPFSAVVHHEGVSSGTSLESGVKSYQLVNQTKFRTKWADTLSHHLEGDATHLRGAQARGPKLRALVVDARVLCPDQDAGSLRMLSVILILQELGFQVTFVPHNLVHVSPYTERMQELGIEFLHSPFFPGFDAFFAERGKEFDVVIISRAEVTEAVLPFCRKHIPNTPVIFDTVDLHFLRGQREAELTRDEDKRKRAAEMEKLELGLSSACDAVVVVSTEETRILKKRLPGNRVALISMIHEVQSVIAPYNSRRDCLFIGGFEHTPNVDAMLWFASKIMPRVIQKLPELRLHIIGSKMPDRIRSLASKNIVTHGYVEHIEPFLQSCLVSVAPLRFGAGVKGKITQSMSWGLPVVSTAIGAEGMHLTHDKNVLVADQAAAFAKHILQLHRDPDLWWRLSQNGLKTIQKYFSVAAAKDNLRQLLLDLGIPGVRARTAGDRPGL
jgi:GT2 family glycosyltransferase/glycosyltransferase involved in cell wall biosynthesis